jgi:hypothetical protein
MAAESSGFDKRAIEKNCVRGTDDLPGMNCLDFDIKSCDTVVAQT